MGTDKNFIKPFGANGPSLLENACALMAGITEVWHVACAKNQNLSSLPCLSDRVENLGPVAGIHRGLEHAREHGYDAVLVLASDMPFVTAEMLRLLVHKHAGADPRPLLTVYRNRRNNKLEMLASLFATGCLPWFEDAIAARQPRLWDLVPLDRHLQIPFGSDLEANFLNCNCPGDLERLKAIQDSLQK